MTDLKNTIDLNVATGIIEYLIDTNRKLEDAGKKTTAISITGAPGIGKTDVIRQIALQRGMTFVKLNLAQIEEVGDLTGFPIKQYKINKIDDNGNVIKTIWANSDTVAYYMNSTCAEYELTEESRMSYATPEWLPKEENPNGIMLFLDDFNRCSSNIAGAAMELINEGTYIGWNKLKYFQIVLSQNPDNGDYNVTSQDTAQKTRYINFNIEFDTQIWAKWAENEEIDSRAINFALYYAEQLFRNDGVSAVNARTYTAFCNAISCIDDWEKLESLGTILTISKGCFDDEDNKVGKLFTTFINLKLDRLIDPKKMLSGKWETVQQEIYNCVYNSSGQYKAEIAAVLSTRLTNYILKLFDTKGGVKSDDVCARILDFVEDSEDKQKRLFSEDILFNICKTLVSKYPARTNKLLMNKKVRSKLI